MGTKMAVSVANIFMAKIESTLIQQSETHSKEWRRYIDDILTLWDSDKKKDVDQFTEEANKFHPTIKFTTEISDNEISLKIKDLSLTYSLKIRLYQKWRTTTREKPGPSVPVL